MRQMVGILMMPVWAATANAGSDWRLWQVTLGEDSPLMNSGFAQLSSQNWSLLKVLWFARGRSYFPKHVNNSSLTHNGRPRPLGRHTYQSKTFGKVQVYPYQFLQWQVGSIVSYLRFPLL